MKHQSKKVPALTAGNHDPLMFWDCSNISSSPSTEKIRKLHIYDFDNTIFKSPGPNPSLYNDQSIGVLRNKDMLHGGGWWCNPLVLRNVGQGWSIESERQWEGFWNEEILELIEESNNDEDTLTVVMTGRKKKLFAGILLDLLESKEVRFDGLVLKNGEFDSTIEFKTQVIADLLNKYEIEELIIYDDRKSQLNGFQEFLNEFINTNRLNNLIYSLIPVFLEPEFLDPKVERELVEDIIERHNMAIDNGENSTVLKKVSFKKSFLYTGYILSTESKVEIIEYLLDNYKNVFTDEVLDNWRFQIEFIPISRSLLPKKLSNTLSAEPIIEWRITEIGFENDLIAIKLRPVEEIDFQEFKSLLPSILPICSKGKSSQKSVDNFLTIGNWIQIPNGIIVKAHFGPVMTFKIIPEHKKKKST